MSASVANRSDTAVRSITVDFAVYDIFEEAPDYQLDHKTFPLGIAPFAEQRVTWSVCDAGMKPMGAPVAQPSKWTWKWF